MAQYSGAEEEGRHSKLTHSRQFFAAAEAEATLRNQPLAGVRGWEKRGEDGKRVAGEESSGAHRMFPARAPISVACAGRWRRATDPHPPSFFATTRRGRRSWPMADGQRRTGIGSVGIDPPLLLPSAASDIPWVDAVPSSMSNGVLL